TAKTSRNRPASAAAQRPGPAASGGGTVEGGVVASTGQDSGVGFREYSTRSASGNPSGLKLLTGTAPARPGRPAPERRPGAGGAVGRRRPAAGPAAGPRRARRSASRAGSGTSRTAPGSGSARPAAASPAGRRGPTPPARGSPPPTTGPPARPLPGRGGG